MDVCIKAYTQHGIFDIRKIGIFAKLFQPSSSSSSSSSIFLNWPK